MKKSHHLHIHSIAVKFWLKCVLYLNLESVHPPPRPILGARDPQEYICWSSCSSTSLSRIRLATLKLAGLSQKNNENMFFQLLSLSINLNQVDFLFRAPGPNCLN